MANAIEVSGVSKKFRLYQEKYTSLKERILHAGRMPYHDFWALDDVSFEIGAGETVGILGRNGCGKSTLLKCIAGILKPTSGEIRLRGQLAAMLELGAGFQPDLTGRENIFLNASLLGMSRKDVEKSFDEIVAFAELEEFIDNQVRFYSSGMYVRLGFAVAVNVDPDILLVDEVLAVGDERFQQKCMQRIHDFQREGRTIVVVSHAADLMRHLCTRVAVMNAGKLKTVAAPGEAIRAFRDILLETEPGAPLPALDDEEETAASTSTSRESDSSEAAAGAGEDGQRFRAVAAGRVKIVGSRLELPPGRVHLLPGEPAAVVIDLETTGRVTGVGFGCSVFSSNGTSIFDYDGGAPCSLAPGRSQVTLRFDSLPLLDDSYLVNVRVQEPGGGVVYARSEPAATIVVENPGTATGLVALGMTVEVRTGVESASPTTVVVEQVERTGA